MDISDAVEVIKIKFPCLLTVEKNIFEPRLPSYRKKILTKEKRVRVIGLEALDDKNEKNYGLDGSPTQVEKIFPPETNNDRKIWYGSPDELAEKITGKLKELRYI